MCSGKDILYFKEFSPVFSLVKARNGQCLMKDKHYLREKSEREVGRKKYFKAQFRASGKWQIILL